MSYGDTPSNTSSTTTSSPWAGVQPYLTGGKLKDGTVIKGIYPQVNEFAKQYGTLTPEEQSLADSYTGTLAGRGNQIQDQYDKNSSLASQLQNGNYDSNLAPVDDSSLPDSTYYNSSDYQNSTAANSDPYASANLSQSADYKDAEAKTAAAAEKAAAGKAVSGSASAAQAADYKDATAAPSAVYNSATALQSSPYTNVNASQADNYQNANVTNASAAQSAPTTLSDLVQGRTSQGTLDPTKALSNLLNGSVDNPYLKAMNQTNIDQATQGYNAQIQKLMQTVMPSINNDAFASGQYGGSRQGIAQGLALQQQEINATNNQQNALDSGNTLYGNAYEAAQNRLAAAAGDFRGD
jgi:hypothetical protein